MFINIARLALLLRQILSVFVLGIG